MSLLLESYFQHLVLNLKHYWGQPTRPPKFLSACCLLFTCVLYPCPLKETYLLSQLIFIDLPEMGKNEER